MVRMEFTPIPVGIFSPLCQEKKSVEHMPLTRKEILHDLVRIFRENFEIDNPGLEDDLREEYEFDSIDAIELLVEIEKMLGFPLTQEEKKEAINIRTFNQICDYIEAMASART